ncbi:MAG: PDZ domain-containing protein, partial [Acidimicrobiia bacterium]|nr:PDZ domain-containing protein [Acidimicrobiia bacterium]
MRFFRLLSPLVAVVLVGAACARPAPRQTEIPRIADTLPRPTTTVPVSVASDCRLAVGSGLGAEVVRLSDGSPAAGVLEPGDVVVSFAGEPIITAADLIATVRDQEIGELYPATVVRGDQEFEVELLIIESAATPGRPVVGVEVTTHVDLYGIGDLPVPAAEP